MVYHGGMQHCTKIVKQSLPSVLNALHMANYQSAFIRDIGTEVKEIILTMNNLE